MTVSEGFSQVLGCQDTGSWELAIREIKVPVVLEARRAGMSRNYQISAEAELGAAERVELSEKWL